MPTNCEAKGPCTGKKRLALRTCCNAVSDISSKRFRVEKIVGTQGSLKNCISHIDASHSRQPLVKGERLVRYEVNAVMTTLFATQALATRDVKALCANFARNREANNFAEEVACHDCRDLLFKVVGDTVESKWGSPMG